MCNCVGVGVGAHPCMCIVVEIRDYCQVAVFIFSLILHRFHLFTPVYRRLIDHQIPGILLSLSPISARGTKITDACVLPHQIYMASGDSKADPHFCSSMVLFISPKANTSYSFSIYSRGFLLGKYFVNN